MRLSAQHRHANETRIRAVMDRLLTGHIPTGANCDLSTLARLADTDRAAFYGNRPYAHLREEFERRLRALRDAARTYAPSPHTPTPTNHPHANHRPEPPSSVPAETARPSPPTPSPTTGTASAPAPQTP